MWYWVYAVTVRDAERRRRLAADRAPPPRDTALGRRQRSPVARPPQGRDRDTRAVDAALAPNRASRHGR